MKNMHSCQSRSEVNVRGLALKCPQMTISSRAACNSGRSALLESLLRKMLVRSLKLCTTLCRSCLIGTERIISDKHKTSTTILGDDSFTEKSEDTNLLDSDTILSIYLVSALYWQFYSFFLRISMLECLKLLAKEYWHIRENHGKPTLSKSLRKLIGICRKPFATGHRHTTESHEKPASSKTQWFPGCSCVRHLAAGRWHIMECIGLSVLAGERQSFQVLKSLKGLSVKHLQCFTERRKQVG